MRPEEIPQQPPSTQTTPAQPVNQQSEIPVTPQTTNIPASPTPPISPTGKSSSKNTLWLVVVVVIVILGVSSWFVYRDGHKMTIKTTTTSTSSSTLGNSALILQRQKYIDNYVGASPNMSYTASYYTPLYNQDYITAALYDELQTNTDNYTQNGRPASIEFTCSASIPSSYSYGTPSISGDSATLVVNEFFSGSSTPSSLTAVWAKNSGVWQFDVIPPHNCFQ